MINIIDDFLDIELYQKTYDKLTENYFDEVVVGDKSFWIQMSTPEFDNEVINKISIIERFDRQPILSFFRVATDEVDTDWRIHSDSIINGDRPERALVLYLSPSTMKGLHGTAFWRHKQLGDRMLNDVTNESFDKILQEDSNDMHKWELESVVGYKVNRCLSYPCNYFHSKYPNYGWESGRIVYVMFYK